MFSYFSRLIMVSALFAVVARCQAPPDAANDQTNPPLSKHIFGIIPNFRTSDTFVLKDYIPLTPRERFRIAAQDSFDRGTVVLAAAFAGQGQLSK